MAVYVRIEYILDYLFASVEVTVRGKRRRVKMVIAEKDHADFLNFCAP